MYYRKINLTDDNYIECVNMISRIETLVYSLYPDNRLSSVWCIAKNYPAFALFHNPKTNELDLSELNITWAFLEDNILNFDMFFKKYHLEYTFAKGFDNVYYPHRHTFPKSSKWSMTFLQKNTEDSLVKFYDVKNSHLYDDEEFQIRVDDQPILIDSVEVDNNEVYSFNTWQWHSWVPNHEKSEYTVFALRDTNTAEDANNVIDMVELL